MLNLLNHKPDIEKMHLYPKDPFETKYQLFINKRESTSLNYLNDSKVFIEYLNDRADNYKKIEEYNLSKKQKKLDRVVGDMFADILSNKKIKPIVTELFMKGRKINISFFFITQSYFVVPKNIRINSAHYFVKKILNKSKLQQIAFNHLSEIDFEDFINLYEKCIAEPYSFWWLILLLYQIILQVWERIFFRTGDDEGNLPVGYPQVAACRGFELMVYQPNSRQLTVFNCSLSTKYLQARIGESQSKVYITLIQKNLSLKSIINDKKIPENWK